MEGFWGILKRETYYGRRFTSKMDLINAIESGGPIPAVPSGGQAAAAYLKGLKENDPIFFSSLSMAARDAMRENVKQAILKFAGKED